MTAPRVIALVGAECTGKSTLAAALQSALTGKGYQVTRVDEFLRTWCDQHQRTPRPNEQATIARAQSMALRAATHSGCDLAISDTTALCTAVYSDVLFGDDSLYPQALHDQRQYALTLLTGVDLPWVADGMQRDGVEARLRFDDRLRAVMIAHGIPYATVLGQGDARVENAMRSIDAHLQHRPAKDPGEPTVAWKWMCERCSDATCEHVLFRGLQESR